MLTQPFFISVRVFYFKSPSNEFTKTCLLSVFIAKFRLVNIHSVIGFNEVWLVRSVWRMCMWILGLKGLKYTNTHTNKNERG